MPCKPREARRRSHFATCHLVGFPPPGVLTAEAQREFQAADDLVLALFFDKIMLVVGECGDGKSTLVNALRDPV